MPSKIIFIKHNLKMLYRNTLTHIRNTVVSRMHIFVLLSFTPRIPQPYTPVPALAPIPYRETTLLRSIERMHAPVTPLAPHIPTVPEPSLIQYSFPSAYTTVYFLHSCISLSPYIIHAYTRIVTVIIPPGFRDDVDAPPIFKMMTVSLRSHDDVVTPLIFWSETYDDAPHKFPDSKL